MSEATEQAAEIGGVHFLPYGSYVASCGRIEDQRNPGAWNDERKYVTCVDCQAQMTDLGDLPNINRHNHPGSAACRRSCPGHGGMLMEKTAARLNTTQCQNDRGEWVPAIPEPLFVGFRLRKSRCECGQTFPNKLRYREHFALAHILGLSC